MALTPKQRLFVDEYLIDLNATQAAIRAGYSERTAKQIGSRMLTNVDVQEAIQEAMQSRSQKTGITADRVLHEMARLAFFDPRKLFDDDGKPKPIQALDDDTAAALAGLDLQEVYEGYGEEREFVGYTKKYKLADKKGALDSIARHLGMFNDKVSVTGTLEHSIKSLTDDQLTARIAQLATEAGIAAASGGAKASEE